VAYRTTNLFFLQMARMDLDGETATQLESVDQTDGQDGLAGHQKLDSANSGQQLEDEEFGAIFEGLQSPGEQPKSLPGTPGLLDDSVPSAQPSPASQLDFNCPTGMGDLERTLLSAGAGAADRPVVAEKMLDEMVRSTMETMKPAAAAPSVSETNFKEAVDSGSFDLRGPVGGHWNLYKKDPAAAASYKACGRVYAAQRAFRQDWAKTEYDKMVIIRTKKTTQRTAFGSFGYQGIMFG
jgi:hypothetical protein